MLTNYKFYSYYESKTSVLSWPTMTLRIVARMKDDSRMNVVLVTWLNEFDVDASYASVDLRLTYGMHFLYKLPFGDCPVIAISLESIFQHD